MPDLQYRLVKHFAKPEPGEFVPIEFIEMTDEEKDQFENVYKSYQEKDRKKGIEVKSLLLSEKFEGE